ncbi:MAG: hypothetical protein LBR89_03285 [Holosporales bacterium]|jgi:hypothetical protein|nr:hypothetical protein [Holosporales bacterium]
MKKQICALGFSLAVLGAGPSAVKGNCMDSNMLMLMMMMGGGGGSMAAMLPMMMMMGGLGGNKTSGAANAKVSRIQNASLRTIAEVNAEGFSALLNAVSSLTMMLVMTAMTKTTQPAAGQVPVQYAQQPVQPVVQYAQQPYTAATQYVQPTVGQTVGQVVQAAGQVRSGW